MVSYPYRDEATENSFQKLNSSPYAFDDKPYLNTMRYSMSGYEPHHLEAKARVDAQGIQDNLYWYQRSRNGRRG